MGPLVLWKAMVQQHKAELKYAWSLLQWLFAADNNSSPPPH